MNPLISLEKQYGASIYDSLPVVLTRGQGVHVWDTDGKHYIDMASAYSAMNHGHSHPRLVAALAEQAQRLVICSRAFRNDKLPLFLQKACTLFRQDMAIPMNTGVEAVETALKTARKWGYVVKGIPSNKAEIIVCRNNFHGRTLGAISFSSQEKYRENFGPFLGGVKIIDFGDSAALEAAITPNTAAFLVEPIQGEGGIHVPKLGYLKHCEKICRQNNVLLILDEIQSGLGRTGKWLACDHDDVLPDGLILGKALGGGMLPVSMFLGKRELMSVLHPGDHGSTFGGNALAAAVGLTALVVLEEEKLIKRAEEMGKYFLDQLHSHFKNHPSIKEIRGRGLFIGIEFINPVCTKKLCIKLLDLGVLCKEIHGTIVRLTPPLVITRDQIDEVLSALKQAIN